MFNITSIFVNQVFLLPMVSDQANYTILSAVDPKGAVGAIEGSLPSNLGSVSIVAPGL